MKQTDFDSEARDQRLLAAYGMSAAASHGRSHPETADPLRSEFQRDRDRVVHSTAFRRLEYKTQVFVNHEGDHYRTRLTHTLEVAQVSRSVARVLGLNEDLVEAIALSHDLGHPPFGHAGEEKLDELMSGSGGFNHNRHCLRVVERLERRYPDFAGLNLTWEIRESIVKHGGREALPEAADYEPQWQPLLEAQLVDIGDSLAYDSHDLDDGLRSGILDEAAFADIELWRRAEERVRQRWPAIGERHRVSRTISALIDTQIQDLISASCERLATLDIDSVIAARQAPTPLIGFSDALRQQKSELQDFLRRKLYHHYRTQRMSEKGKRFIEALFVEYDRKPMLLPEEYRQRAETESRQRVICDYIAGMTDRYCQQEYLRMFSPFGDGMVM